MDADQLVRAVGTAWSTAPGERNLARRLAERLRQLVEAGVLASGDPLPAERLLASALNVSRPTVSAALDELRRDGVLRSRQGSGTWVTDTPSSFSGPAMADVVLGTEGINLAAAVPADTSHLASLDLRVDVNRLAATTARFGHEPVGLPELRAALADRHARFGASADADQVIVTDGAHHALWLLLGALTWPADNVLVERHTYPGMLDLLDAHRLLPVAIDRDELGACPRSLDHALRTTAPRLVYLAPGVHAPTGHATPPGRLDELAAVLDRHDATVIADDTLADLRFVPPVPPLGLAVPPREGHHRRLVEQVGLGGAAGRLDPRRGPGP